MITNYLKTAVRNLWINKGFSTINISGLALGMTCGLLILLWVRYEKSGLNEVRVLATQVAA